MGRGSLVYARVLVPIIISVIVVASAIVFFAFPKINVSTTTASPITGSNVQGAGYIITTDAAPYFPNGYYSQKVSLLSMKVGDSFVVGQTTFTLEAPPDTISGQTVDYQCGLSLDGRPLLSARLANGTSFTLDYCLLLNQVFEGPGPGQSQQWNFWEISKGTAPVVAIHVSGTGSTYDYMAAEVWVSK